MESDVFGYVEWNYMKFVYVKMEMDATYAYQVGSVGNGV